MKIRAAVLEPDAAERRRIVEGLKKAGVAVSEAMSTAALRAERLVVLGPGAAKAARTAARAAPAALVLAAQRKLGKAPGAHGILPLPVSPNDLRVRLPELLELRKATARPRRDASPSQARAGRLAQRPGDGILDPLTSFYTFAHFKEVLFIEVKRARRYGFPLSMALVGFDPLEANVTAGLRAQLFGGLALAIRRSLRDTDYPVQYSADRVLLLMPHTDLTGALVVSRRICERVGRASLAHGGAILRPTISVGVAAAPPGQPGREISFAEMVKRAQESLDAALAGGGNRVEFFDSAAAAAGADAAVELQADPAQRGDL